MTINEEAILKGYSLGIYPMSESFDDPNKSGMPSGPLELMNVLRRARAMDEATTPSDALDEAIQAFESQDVEDTAPLLN